MITLEQIVNSQKSSIDTLTGLSGNAFEGVEKLIELNISAARTATIDTAEATKAALSGKDAQGLFALQQNLLQLASEKAAFYSRSVYEIAASTSAEVSRVAEAQSAEAQAKFMSFIDAAVENAPAGSENGVALLKSAIATANNAIETAKKAAKQATEVAETTFQAVTKQAVRAVQTGSKAKRAA